MKSFSELTSQEKSKLEAIGLLWELYPENREPEDNLEMVAFLEEIEKDYFPAQFEKDIATITLTWNLKRCQTALEAALEDLILY